MEYDEMPAIVGIIILVFCLCSLVSNFAALTILMKSKQKSTSNMLFIVLNANDIFIITLSLTNLLPLIVRYVDEKTAEDIFCALGPVVINYVSLLPLNISNIIVCLICVDRFVALKYPTSYKYKWNTQVVCKCLCATYILVPLISVLKAFVLHAYYNDNNNGMHLNVSSANTSVNGNASVVVNITNICVGRCYVTYTPFYLAYAPILRLYALLLEIFLDVLPLLLTVGFGFYVACRLREIKLAYDPTNPAMIVKKNNLRKSTTIATCVVFLHICSSIPMIVWFANYLATSSESKDLVEQLQNPSVFLLIVVLLELTNTMTNSLVFVLFSPQYRHYFKTCLCKSKVAPLFETTGELDESHLDNVNIHVAKISE